MNLIEKALLAAGGKKLIAEKAGLTWQGVHKWTTHGLPWTEETGDTNYIGLILGEIKKENKRHGKTFTVSRTALLKASKELK